MVSEAHPRRSDYDQVVDGDSFKLANDQDLYLACCACGLTHRLSFSKLRGGIQVTIHMAPRNTAMIRRHNRFP